MTMSIILADAIDKTFNDRLSHSVTLAANDVLIFRFTNRKVGSAAFNTFTWNGLPCTMFIDQNSRDVRSQCGYIKAPAGATANLVSSISPTFTQLNLGIVIVRSATNAMLANPVKSSSSTKLDSETTYVEPSRTLSGLVANDLTIAFLDWLGQGIGTGYPNVQSTTSAPNSPLTLNDSVQNSNATGLGNPGRMYISTASGITGSQTFSHTKTGAGQPMYNYAVIALYESLYLVDTFNAGNDITAGQQNVLYTTTGFTTITGITSNRPGVTVSGISDIAGDGNADISGFVEGGLYPILPSSVTFTFSDGTNTAPITKNLTIPAGYEQISFLNAMPFNDRVFAWHLQQAGISIADGTRVISPITPGFSFLPNGDTDSDALRTVTAWVRDISTGTMSEWAVTIAEGGGVISVVKINAIPVTSIAIKSIAIKQESPH